MPIIGLLLRHSGPVLFCNTDFAECLPGEQLMVETEHGQLLASVVSLPGHLPSGCLTEQLCVLRKASENDKATAVANKEMEQRASRFCRECIRNRKLDMKLVDVEVYFDASKIIFYFTAPARIDFRELLKDLVREYRARIELRQIGVRHEAQMTGAVGNCGMVCCCRRFLRKFAPVTIRMAKEQNLFLNPAKISGICGRLLCCLSYEQENYDSFHRECPRLGKRYDTNQGSMKVLRANMFRSSLSVLDENNEELELDLEEWRAMEPRRPDLSTQLRPPARVESPKNDNSGFLVVSVTPESLDDPDLFGDIEDFDEEHEQDGQDSDASDLGHDELRRGRRKRKPRQK